MAAVDPRQLLAASLHCFEAAQMCLREWEMVEDRETVKDILWELAETRSLTEFIQVLRKAQR